MNLVVDFVFLIIGWFFRLILLAMTARAVIGWLMMAGIVNYRVWGFKSVLDRVTDPIIDPFRRVVPVVGGIDLAFSLAYIVILFISQELLPVAQMNTYRLMGMM